jgi:superoxide reductase
MEIYKCEKCDNVIEMVNAGAGELVCCGQPMTLMQPKSQEEGMEKHLPVVEKTDTGILVKVGSVPHPMEEKHYIQWIEAVTGTCVIRKTLKPGETPEADFKISDPVMMVRSYCNIHGLWIKEL